MKNQSTVNPLAQRLYDLFVANTQVYGVEDESGWRTVKQKLTVKKVEDHLSGRYTLGVYPFNKKGYVKWICLDIDYKGGELFYAYMCKKFSPKSTIEVDTGGRGVHIFVFLQPTPLWQIAPKLEEIEEDIRHRVFPKQRELRPDMIGNFVRMPLGKHHKTGKWSRIIKGDIWKVKPYQTCKHRAFNQHGHGNCLAIDGTIGYCHPNLCPKHTSQTDERGNKEGAGEYLKLEDNLKLAYNLKYVHVQNM